MVIPAHLVIIATDVHTSRHTVRKMEAVLSKQGQIEPLQVRLYATRDDGVNVYITCDEDVHATDIVLAARNLAWSTLLVLVVDKYIQ
jgi:nitrogen fixation/metabolism regulation signal transduction histidine kinase